MVDEKRRDFLKKAGIFAGALAMLSVFNSNTANAGTLVKDKETGFEQLKIEDDNSIKFLPNSEKNITITSKGDIIISKRITASYTYTGEINSIHGTLIPLPPGMFYPINQVWGYDYNFVKEVKINGNPISFNEFISIDKNGFFPVYSSRQGRGANYGFAWCVRTFESLNYGDVVEATIETKELLDSIKGIRIGRKYIPDADDLQTYSYPVRGNADDPTVPWDPAPIGRDPNNKIFWIYPNTDDYAIIAFSLSRFNQTHYSVNIWESTKVGKSLRPTFYVNADTYQNGILDTVLFPLRSYRAVKLAIFHKPTGAISKLNHEVILRTESKKASLMGWQPSIKLK